MAQTLHNLMHRYGSRMSAHGGRCSTLGGVATQRTLSSESWHQRHPVLAFLMELAGLVGLLALAIWREQTAIQGSPDSNFGWVLIVAAFFGF
jgi:hypothetical protein